MKIKIRWTTFCVCAVIVWMIGLAICIDQYGKRKVIKEQQSDIVVIATIDFTRSPKETVDSFMGRVTDFVAKEVKPKGNYEKGCIVYFLDEFEGTKSARVIFSSDKDMRLY